jgi:hypothetical protein
MNWFRNCRECRCKITHKELRALKGFATGAWFDALGTLDENWSTPIVPGIIDVLMEFDEAVAMIERGKL